MLFNSLPSESRSGSVLRLRVYRKRYTKALSGPFGSTLVCEMSTIAPLVQHLAPSIARDINASHVTSRCSGRHLRVAVGHQIAQVNPRAIVGHASRVTRCHA